MGACFVLIVRQSSWKLCDLVICPQHENEHMRPSQIYFQPNFYKILDFCAAKFYILGSFHALFESRVRVRYSIICKKLTMV